MPSPHAIKPLLATLLLCALASSAQDQQPAPSTPAADSYKPPALSLEASLESDKILSDAAAAYSQSGDSAAFRAAVQSAASSGDLAAELLLAEHYIPDHCPYDPDRDVPNCGPDGKHNPKVLLRTNPLDLPGSYENACHWLERASAQGSGEASEILAQLITRMLFNGHATAYTPADSARFHTLARTQGFDIEPLSVSCYQLTPAGAGAHGLTYASSQRRVLTAGAASIRPFSDHELQTLQAAGASGLLHFEGVITGNESPLLTRPAGPAAHIRLILDHTPEHEIYLPIPEHRDVIYLQSGDHFLALPPDVPTLSRSISITPQRPDLNQVSAFIQGIDGTYTGDVCARF